MSEWGHFHSSLCPNSFAKWNYKLVERGHGQICEHLRHFFCLECFFSPVLLGIFPLKLGTDVVLRVTVPSTSFLPSEHLVAVMLLPALSMWCFWKSGSLIILSFNNNDTCIMFCLSLEYLHVSGQGVEALYGGELDGSWRPLKKSEG